MTVYSMHVNFTKERKNTMIFYFTGTGNSLYAAKRLAKAEGGELVNMAENRGMPHEYTLSDESVGFVFPVYYYTVNDVVAEFVEKLKITGAGYTYAVVTCGGSIGGTGALLKEMLAKRGIKLDAVYSVVMTDNAMLYYNISDGETAEKELKKADGVIDNIIAAVAAKKPTDFGTAAVSKLSRGIYHAAASTKKFAATDKCISCGKCAMNCPDKAIVMENGRPKWVKNKCVLCLGCINRCPAAAIQHGRKTEKRNRYENKKAFE